MDPWGSHIYGVFPASYNPAAEGGHREKHTQGGECGLCQQQRAEQERRDLSK